MAKASASSTQIATSNGICSAPAAPGLQAYSSANAVDTAMPQPKNSQSTAASAGTRGIGSGSGGSDSVFTGFKLGGSP